MANRHNHIPGARKMYSHKLNITSYESVKRNLERLGFPDMTAFIQNAIDKANRNQVYRLPKGKETATDAQN